MRGREASAPKYQQDIMSSPFVSGIKIFSRCGIFIFLIFFLHINIWVQKDFFFFLKKPMKQKWKFDGDLTIPSLHVLAAPFCSKCLFWGLEGGKSDIENLGKVV